MYINESVVIFSIIWFVVGLWGGVGLMCLVFYRSESKHQANYTATDKAQR